MIQALKLYSDKGIFMLVKKVIFLFL